MKRAIVFIVVQLAVALLQFNARPNPLSDAAVAVHRPGGAPRASDICFSSRWPRPLDSSDPLETFAAARDFGATRFDWNYPLGSEFVRAVKSRGYGYFGTISAELDGTSDRTGRDKSYRGDIVGNPELDFLAARGDVASEAYRQRVRDHVFRMLDGGADGIYVDDPGMTYHNAIYNGGGFGDVSMRQFAAFLAQHTSTRQRADWQLPDDLSEFDYAAYVRQRGGKPPKELEELFYRFHRESVDRFYTWLRGEADRRAGRHVPFGCNNWSVLKQQEFPFQEHFDFWIGETSVRYARPTPQLLYEKVQNAQRLGKLQCFSPPNDGLDVIATREEYVALTRRIIASSYACGSATLVPWDVWRRGEGTPRFFGTVAEFGDLYRMVADHKDLFDRHEQVFAVGPGIAPQPAAAIAKDLVTAHFGGKEMFVSVRAVPGNDRAPIVVHLVNWSSSAEAGEVELDNVAFGGSQDKALTVELLIAGKPMRVADAQSSQRGRTRVAVPTVAPYALLVVRPGR